LARDDTLTVWRMRVGPERRLEDGRLRLFHLQE
jgi:hypothetical protein